MSEVSGKTWNTVEFNNGKVYLTSDFLIYSDYSGSSVEVSNVKAILDDYEGELDSIGYENINNPQYLDEEDCPTSDIVTVTGGYGTRGIILADNAENRKIMARLDNYPLLDECLMSEVEMEAEDEAWDSWIKKDLIRAYEKLADEIGEIQAYSHFETLDDKAQNTILFDAYCQAKNASNECGHNETGNQFYIDIDKIKASFLDIFEKAIKEEHYKALNPVNENQLEMFTE